MALQRLGYKKAFLTVAFVSDKTIKKMNASYRSKNYATDVLSFATPLGFYVNKNSLMGDVIIAPNVAKKNAEKDNKRLKDELIELLVHGLLHIAGYEHGEKMFKLQFKIVKEVLLGGRLKRVQRKP